MNSLASTIRDIKSLKIQGAQNISKSALKTLRQVVISSKTGSLSKFFHEIDSAKKLLIKTRPTEPCLRNSLEYVFNNVKGADIRELREDFLHKIVSALKFFKDSENIINEITAAKIKDNMTIFTHCHSSSVVNAIKKAKEQGKKFEVHNTETRPLFQGRKTAKELAAVGINVTHYVDSAARLALRNCDLMLIGCDAITSEGKIINKIGSELFAEVADKHDIPVYSCTNSWKFDPKTVFLEEPIEHRKSEEVWKNPPKRVKISNFAFEKVDPDLVTGIICELGVYKPPVLVEEIRRNYPWMFVKKK